ncbi:hypothetical protein LINPERHAP1_LOCUS12344, partial [Linum perenne]
MSAHSDSSVGSGCTSVVSCKHNLACAIKTSGTEKNPGRKFYCCRHWKDKTLDCRFFKWVDAGKDEEYIAQLEAECRGLKLTVAELQRNLETTKAKALRRKGELHLTQKRLGDTVDECTKLVSHIRSVHLVVCRLERYMTYGILGAG